jgi:hypothetical protein
MRSKTVLTRFIHGFAWWKMTRPLLPSNLEKQHAADQKNRTLKTPCWNPFRFFVILIIAGLGFWMMADRPFIQKDEEGNYVLAPWRKRKLERELKAIDEAEQYALRASTNGWYDCFNCPGSRKIYLLKGEVWKYGHTVNGEKVRYGKWHREKGLLYFAEFKGTLSACIKEEKRKIYFYAILPENLKRNDPLIRPPGNKIDY